MSAWIAASRSTMRRSLTSASASPRSRATVATSSRTWRCRSGRTAPRPSSEPARSAAWDASAHGARSPSGEVRARSSSREAERAASATSRVSASTRAERSRATQVPPPTPSATTANRAAARPTARMRRLRSSTACASARAWASSAALSRSCIPARCAVRRAATTAAFLGRSFGAAARQDFASSTSSASASQASSRARHSARSAPIRLAVQLVADEPVYGGRPVRISARIAPRPKTSARSSSVSSWPRACSGAMYAGVPRTEPARDSSASEPVLAVRTTPESSRTRRTRSSSATPAWSSTLASPQSITWTSPKLPTMMFDGLRSRWITPQLWA